MEVILASASPRREKLLGGLLRNFKILPANVDEDVCAACPKEAAMQIALKKAKAVSKANPHALVLGADTIVVLDNEVFGKPANAVEAVKMLKRLSGRTHFVYTGVALVRGERESVFCECSAVTFNQLADAEIEKYVASGAPLDKAGGYGVQDSGFVKEIDGSYANVVGLPIEKLEEKLVAEGVDVRL